MATIHKLTKDGSTIFPATITDAIVHPNTGKTLTSMIKDYNVSELFPSEGLDGGNKYNLALAIQVLGTHLTAAEKTGGIKITFISSVSQYPEEEYYLNKNTWSTTLSDWGQRFEVGGVIANPSGSWEPGTAEAYIDQEIATVTTNIASETIGRQTADTNLQTQINSEVSNRNTIDTTQNTRIGVLEEAYRNLTESDVIVGPRPSSGQQANVIYREPDQDHTPPQFYCDYMWYNNAWVLMAQYDNGIDDNPLPSSNNLVKSSGVFNNMGAFDISAYNSGATYLNLSAALAGVPSNMKAGGMSVKFIQETPAQYSVVKIENLTTQPTGTALSTDPNIVSGTYTAAQLSNLNTAATLPSTLNSSNTYYLEVSTGNYTSWVVTYVHTSGNKYVQYRLIADSWSATVTNWQGVDDEPATGSDNLIKSGGVKAELDKIKYGERVNLNADETIGSKFIYKRGVLTNGYQDYSLLKYDISELSGVITLSSNSIENESVYAYTIHNTSGNAISYPADSENIIAKKDFTIDLSNLTNHKWLYVAAPAAYVINIKESDIQKINKEIQTLSEEIVDFSNDIEELKEDNQVLRELTYSDAIKLNLLLNSTYNTFVICGNGGAFYAVSKGTKVEITARSNQATAYAFLNTLPAEVEGTPADYMDGENLVTIPADGSASAVAPGDGYLYIQNKVWGTDTFPDEVMMAYNAIPLFDEEIKSLTDNPDKDVLFEPGYTFRHKELDKVSEGVITQNYIFDNANDGFITTDYIEVEDYNIKPYCIYIETMGQYNKLIEFYDKNKNIIKTIMGNGPTGNTNDFSRKVLKVKFPAGCKYVRYARYGNYTNLGLYRAFVVTMDEILNEFVTYSVFTENNNILWVGTSITEGSQYPIEASRKCGYNAINQGQGSSSLCALAEHPSTLNNASGRRLTMTVAEIETMFRPDVTRGAITEEQLTEWKNSSYEVKILPYINGADATQVSMVVIDHGFNDRFTIHSQLQDVQNIDWNSNDRTTFTGAFRYILNEITKINPFIKIVISGYFQNTYMHTDYYADEICRMQELIAEHYSISIMKAWEHSQINGSYVAGTSNYLAEFNAQYGTSYTAYSTDNNGNILSMQLYCPDMVHPHSDRSGRCNERLNAVYSKLLRDLL